MHHVNPWSEHPRSAQRHQVPAGTEAAHLPPAHFTPTHVVDHERRQPGARDLSVSFTLPGAGLATLVVYDVSGREVSRREVGSLGAGRHVVTLGAPGRLAPGIYLVHLIQGERRLVTRAVVIR